MNEKDEIILEEVTSRAERYVALRLKAQNSNYKEVTIIQVANASIDYAQEATHDIIELVHIITKLSREIKSLRRV